MTNDAIGEAVTEAEAEQAPDCDCTDGMFPAGKLGTSSRRAFLRGGSLLTAAAIVPVTAFAADEGEAPWSVPGRIAKSDYGARAPFEKVMRLSSAGGTSSLTPLQAGVGIITPSGWHFERHHNGVPTIDPKQQGQNYYGDATPTEGVSIESTA